MKFDQLFAFLGFLGAVTAQSFSGLTFDGRNEVSFIWASESEIGGHYDLYLCAGDESTESSYEALERVIDDGVFSSGERVSFRINPDLGGNDPNAYFLKVVSVRGDPIGFTAHFTLANMKGSFSPHVSKAIMSMQPVEFPSISSTNVSLDDAETHLSLNTSDLIDGLAENTAQSFLRFPVPDHVNELSRNELRKRLGVDAHNIPYGEQTGLTKYAPMPKRAGSTIAEGSPTPQYPPFPFSIATTYLPAPTVQYTDTAYLTWTTHSIENTAAPAAAPTLDKRMQMWLERWKD